MLSIVTTLQYIKAFPNSHTVYCLDNDKKEAPFWFRLKYLNAQKLQKIWLKNTGTTLGSLLCTAFANHVRQEICNY